jgi:hypothetical protein
MSFADILPNAAELESSGTEESLNSHNSHNDFHLGTLDRCVYSLLIFALIGHLRPESSLDSADAGRRDDQF